MKLLLEAAPAKAKFHKWPEIKKLQSGAACALNTRGFQAPGRRDQNQTQIMIVIEQVWQELARTTLRPLQHRIQHVVAIQTPANRVVWPLRWTP